jgi:hypothetical protein
MAKLPKPRTSDSAATDIDRRTSLEPASSLADRLEPTLQAELDDLTRVRCGLATSTLTTIELDDRVSNLERNLVRCRRIRINAARYGDEGALRLFAANEK